MKNNFDRSAQTVVSRCLDVKKDEAVLILCDEPMLEIAQALQATCRKKTRNCLSLQLTSEALQRDLLASVTELMQQMNVIIAVTSIAVSHTDGFRAACSKGARAVTMPNILSSTFSRLAGMNFERVARRSIKIADVLSFTQNVEVKAPNGTELRLCIADRKGYADTGLVHNPGDFSNLPAGEACIAPLEGMVEGEVVVDCGLDVSREDDERLVLSIKEGRIARISGGKTANRLRQKFAKVGAACRMVAELGIGTNDAAVISGYSLEDEKVLGTMHVGFGNNLAFGGTVDAPIHLDAVVYKATVVMDGRKIVENGKLLLD